MDILKKTPHAAPSGLVIRHIYADLTFDGSTFTVETKNSCGHRGLGGVTPYTAPTSGPLVFAASSTISVTPRCVPSTAPSPVPQLYIFAIDRDRRHSPGAHWNGVPVAGPANLTDNPWIFTPMSPGLTMVGGDNYDFVIATSWQHPSPEPSASSSP
jgi:hypothetical protein